MRLSIVSLMLLLLTAPLLGCGSKVSVKPGFGDGSIQTVAVLPPRYNSGVQREKVDAIVNAVEAELKNKEYVVLAESLVSRTCSAPECPERNTLAEKYLVDAFVAVDVRSVSRNNFLAGYYNAITGKLTLTDKDSNVLLDADETESERGGLVFNSGQVIQGLISQVENTEENSFGRLSAKFAETMVAKIPKPKALAAAADSVTVALNTVKTRKISPLFYEVCADATPNSLVSLIIDRARSTLREMSPGKYCGTFFLDNALLAAPMHVEARSPFGTTVRKDFSPGVSVAKCDLEGQVFLASAGDRKKIVVSCPETPNASDSNACDPSLSACPNYKFLIFKGPSALGPYQKVAETKAREWIDRTAKSGDRTYYEVVAVSPTGAWSLPRKPKALVGSKS